MKRLLGAVCALVLLTLAFGCAPGREDYSVMAEMTDVVHLVEREYPAINDSVVKSAKMSPVVYAITQGATITVNELFSSDRRKLEDSVAYDVSVGWHPRLGHCTGAQFIAYHEAAHLVDGSEGRIAHNMLNDRFGNGKQLHGILSEYSFHSKNEPYMGGTINYSEALAEAFAAVHCGGGNPVERELNQMLKVWGNV